MGKRNRPFGGHRPIGVAHNRFGYDGPYPMHEINSAKQLLNYQFYNSNNRFMNSLKMKMMNSINFFHEAQIETVVPSSFGAIQEEQSLLDKTTVVESQIDIHNINESSTEKEVSEINILEIKQSESLLSIQTSTICSFKSDEEPLEKRQKLSNATVTMGGDTVPSSLDNLSTVQFDSNGNIENTAAVIDNKTDDPKSYKAVTTQVKNRFVNGTTVEVVISDEDIEDGELLDEEVKDETDTCFMCDLCLHVVRGCSVDSERQMKIHFTTAQHGAASMVEAKIDGDKLIPRFVIEKHCLSHNSVQSDILPVCPECNQIQGSIWTCALHYQQNHNSSISNVYALGKVTGRTTVHVSPSHTCQKCNLQFPTANKLHKHWKSKKHFPFKEQTGNQIMLFICKACGRKEQSFLMQRGHILSAHLHNKNNATSEMQVLYVEKTPSLCLLPEKSKPIETQLSEGKQLFSKAMKSEKLTKNQRRRMRKSVLPSKNAVYEYKNGKPYDKDKARYERFLHNHLHYDRFHYNTPNNSF